MSDSEPAFSAAQQRRFLDLALATVRRHLGVADAAIPDRWPPEDSRFGGLFVTYWSGEKLRGCVGTFVPTSDLWQSIQDVAVAALADPRFVADRITVAELQGLRIELSLLSDLTPTTDPLRDLRPGLHGVVIHRGDQSGCFLPKVAEQRGWTAEEFLSHCCTMKAGLPADAWRDPETNVFLFTATSLSSSGP